MVRSAPPVKSLVVALLAISLVSGCSSTMHGQLVSWRGEGNVSAPAAFNGPDCNGLVCLVSRTMSKTVPFLPYGEYPAFTQACIDKFVAERDPHLMKRYSIRDGSADRITLLLQGDSKSLVQKQLGRIERLQLFLNYNMNRGSNDMEVTITVERAGELYGDGWTNDEITESMLTPIGPNGEQDIESFLDEISNSLHNCDLRPLS